MKNEVIMINNKLQNLTENMEIFLGLCEEIVNSYDSKKRNYQQLMNILKFDFYKSIVLNDINTIINDDNIIDKINDLMDIHYKMDNKNISNKEKSKKEKIIEKLNMEINNFKLK